MPNVSDVCKMGAMELLVLSLFLAVVCAAQTGCDLPLGLESGAILDSQITATTWVNVLEGPRYARLHKRDGGGGWTSSKRDQSQHLTVDLRSSATVTAVATQGRYNTDDYVTSYKLLYSADGSTWTTYTEGDKDMTFQGNEDGDLAHKNVLPRSIEARYIRFNPTLFNGAPSMRIEVYGCLKDTAYFDGSTYIKYDVSQPSDHIQTKEDLIQLRFRTSQPDGILVAGVGTHSDYIYLALSGGKIVLNLNLGDTVNDGALGATTLEGGSLLDDNHWHFVEYKHQQQTVELVVDGVSVAAKTNGLFARLDLDKEVTVGGASKQHKDLTVNQFFIGCLQNVLLSNSVLPSRLGTALNFINVVHNGARNGASPNLSLVGQLNYECRGVTSIPATFPSRESYIRWPGPSLSKNFTITLKFRTFTPEGLFIHNEMISSSDGFVTVGLSEGAPVVILKADNNGPIEIFGGGSNLNDGRWHSIHLEMASNKIRWTVDDVTDVSQQTFSMQTSQNYYVGGFNGGSSNSGDLLGFRGCMKDVFLGDDQIDFSSILDGTKPDSAISEGVDIDTCSLEDWCTPNPCSNGGKCASDWDTFTCDCTDTGYTGATCSIPQHSSSCQFAGMHTIDRDGSGPLAPLEVECEGLGEEVLTVIHHDAESAEDVPPGSTAPGSYPRDITYQASHDQIKAIVDMSEYCEQHIKYECTRAKLLNSPGSYSRDIVYQASQDQIKATIDMSEYCEQHIKYECTRAKLLNSPYGEPFGWWVNRNGQKMNYWGGAAPGTGKCACGLFETCFDTSKWCNCDAESARDQVDEGLLKHKQYLPVKQLRFGDVKTSGSSASYTLGPLKCKGNAYQSNVVSFRTHEAHLLLPTDSLLHTQSLTITLEFKTTQSSAVLAAADGPDDTFIKLELYEAQTIRFEFDYGAGVKKVEVDLSSPINDNGWHPVMVTMDTKEATLNVDRGQTRRLSYIMGKLRLRLTDDFFVGASTLQSEGFVGCMRNLQLNGRFINMVAASKSARLVEAGCTGNCDQKPCLNDGTCLETYDDEVQCQCDMTAYEGDFCSKEIGSRMEMQSEITYKIPAVDVQDTESDIITLAFTTKIARGRLLRIQGSSSGLYEEVAITNPEGNLTFTYKLGSGEPVVLTSGHNYADSKHHFVEIKRDGNEASLKVDYYLPVTVTTPGVDTTFGGADNVIVGSQDEATTFEGCISRVRFNNIYPLKAYYTSPRPDGVTWEGNMQKSRCNVEEIVPKLAKPIDPGPPTHAPPIEGTKPLPPAPQTLKAGDKAAIAFVIIILLVGLIVLILLIARYTHQHKGMYHTNEAKGADAADSADTAVMMTGSKQLKPEKKREWYI